MKMMRGSASEASYSSLVLLHYRRGKYLPRILQTYEFTDHTHSIDEIMIWNNNAGVQLDANAIQASIIGLTVGANACVRVYNFQSDSANVKFLARFVGWI